VKALVTLVLVGLLVAGCAGESGDGAGPTTTQEKTTANSTEETTVYEEETTVLVFPEPPDSTLSYGGRKIKGTLGTYCWSSSASSEYPSGCADSFGPPIAGKQQTLTVPPDSGLVFRYGGQNPPKSVEAGAYSLKKLMKAGGVVRTDRTLKTQGSGVQRTIPAELSPGEYVLEVTIEANKQDGADYYFRVMVE
jgi:hypothetical protein